VYVHDKASVLEGVVDEEVVYAMPFLRPKCFSFRKCVAKPCVLAGGWMLIEGVQNRHSVSVTEGLEQRAIFVLGLHERLVMVLTSGNARLMQATLVQAHKMGRSLAGMLEMATNCLHGLYKPRPRFTDVDMSVGMLVYTFGGTVAAHAVNKALGLPCARLIRKVKELVAHVPMSTLASPPTRRT